MTDDNLHARMDLSVTGGDEAAAQILKIRDAIEAITAPARRASAQIKRLAEQFDLIGTSATTATTKASTSIERLASTVAGETRQIRTELAGTFIPLGKSAKEGTTAASTSMSALATETSTAVARIRTAAATAFEPISVGMTAATETVTAGFAKINAAMAETIAQAKAAATEIKAISAPVAVPGSRNANLRRAAGRGHSGPHFRGDGVRAPGGHISLGSGPVVGAAAVGGYAVWEAMQVQDEALRLALTSQVDPKEIGVSAAEYQRSIMAGAAETGESVEAVADAYQRGIRGMQGVDPAKRLDLIKALLPTARAESKLKGAPLGETLQSFIELGHQTGVYDPAHLKALSSKLAIASLSVNSSLPEFGRTLSYSLPVLHAGIGLDADSVIALTAAMQNAGVNSTKSGTWIRSFYQGLLPKAGAKADDKHNSALARLGLGSPDAWQVRDSAGNIDWGASTDRSVEIMRDRTAKMSESEKATFLHDAFGERGSSIASLLMQKTVQEQFDGIHKKIAGGGEVDLFSEYAENSSLQKAQQTWRDTQNLLIDIGNTALPAVNTGLRDLDNLVKEVAAAIKGNWQDLGKDLWDHLVKPDLGPFGKDSGKDLPPMQDRWKDMQRGLKKDTADIQWNDDQGTDRTGWNAAMLIWADTANNIRDLKTAFTQQAMAAWQGAKADLDQIKDGVQLLGQGLAAWMQQSGLGSSGAQNASYETGGGGSGSGFRGLPAIGKGVGHLYSASVREAWIRHEAAIRHIDPDIAMAVARSEGFNTFRGDYGTSFGDFQMHTAGDHPGMRSRGLGDLYREQTGKDPSDPRNERDLDRFALDQVAKDGWGAWHGARRIGITGRRGLDYHGQIPAAPDAAQMVQQGVTRPNSPAPSRRPKAAAPIINVNGAGDPHSVALHVGRIFASSRLMNTVDSDFDT